MANYGNDGTLVSRMFAGLANGISNLWNKITGNQLTSAEREANEFSSNEAALARQFSHNEAQEQMRFQREMSDTQWQRGVADMQNAGLNPALAYGQGGASAMQGAAGSASAASSVDPAAASSLSELIQLATLPKELKRIEAETAAAEASANQSNANANKTNKEASWIDVLNDWHVKQVQKELQIGDKTIEEKDYNNALTKARELQVLKDTSWIDRLNQAETDALKAKELRDAAEAAISEYEKEHGYRLGSNEWLALTNAILNFFGLTADGLGKTITDAVKRAMNTEVPAPHGDMKIGPRVFKSISHAPATN